MEQQRGFSHGLLYSVAPQDISELHLQDGSRSDDFRWEDYKYWSADRTFAQATLAFLKVTAAKWGLTRH